VTRPRVIAHRGSSARHADNTWAAFNAAVAEGADAIECDAMSTHDGTLVVRHDLTLAGRQIADLDAAQIEAFAPGTLRLADVIAWAAGARIDLLVEVKDPDAAEAIGVLVSASAWREHIVMAGFHGPSLAALKQANPGLRTSFMMGSVVAADDLVHLASRYHADGVHPCWEGRAARPHRLLDAAFVDRVRRAGLTLTLWHEEREEELRALVAVAPDAICTNTPAVLRAIVGARAIG
jgi:glycerophosphoryl diester phosphodiesterase